MGYSKSTKRIISWLQNESKNNEVWILRKRRLVTHVKDDQISSRDKTMPRMSPRGSCVSVHCTNELPLLVLAYAKRSRKSNSACLRQTVQKSPIVPCHA